mmetsp:Transcript_24066/g.44406  ORF Transcript_24066/g.44406 Transcript_24066/m.44406 type:complete len:325 (+) Transcript_24066:9126-10100(+)
MRSAVRPVILETVEYQKGSMHEVADIATSNVEEKEQIQKLLADGFKHYSVADNGSCRLAEQAIAKALANSAIPASEIGTVLFGSESFWDVDQTYSKQTFSLEHQLFRANIYNALELNGLGSANLMGYWANGCANVGVALQLAAGLIQAESSKAVLIVYIDRHPEDQTRIIHNGITVASDICLALILAGEGAQGPALSLVVPFSDLSLMRVRERDSLENYLISYARSTKYAIDHFLQVSGRKITDFSGLIAPNFTMHYMRLQYSSARHCIDMLNMGSKAEIAHATSADPFVTLKNMEGTGDSERLLMLMGPFMWAFVLLTYEGEN